MQAIAHYALLGSLAAGIAGAIILALVTLLYGFSRRRDTAEGEEESAEQSTLRTRTTRVADTLAVLCFAVAASLGVIGLTQQPRPGAPPADGTFAERMQRLESRLAGAESELHARSAPIESLKAWEERLARLESRLGAIEERATVADRRADKADERAAVADKRVKTAEERAAAADHRAQSAERVAQAAERLAREQREDRVRDAGMVSPSLAPPAPPVPTPAAVKPAPVAPMAVPPRSAPIAPERPDASVKPDSPPAPSASPATPTATRTSLAPRDAPRVSRAAAAKPREPTLREKLHQDWEAIKRDASRGGDDWRQGWDQLRRLFTP